MAMKLICGCLLALVLLGCVADAQYFGKPQQNQKPQPPQQRPRPQPIPQPIPQPVPRPLPKPQQPNPQPYPGPGQNQKQPIPPPEPFHTCEVEEHHKIQCGALNIGAQECEAINCCFDGRMCYYGKSVTLQCTKDAQIILVVARDATLPNIDLESVTFLGTDPNCSPVATTSAFAIYQFPVTTCGTLMTEEPGVVIYENRLSSLYEVAVGPYGAITRDSHFELVCQCRYTGTSVEALVIDVGLVPPPPPVAAPGPLYVELRLANGQCHAKGCVEEDVAYTSFYVDSDYPVMKVLRDPVYVEVRILERTDPNIVLTLGRCWATANPYAHSLPQWDLLIDGCPYRDDRYLTSLVPVGASSGLLFPTHHRRFAFKMFTFVSTGGGADQNKGGHQTGKGPTYPGKGGADPGVMIPLREKIYIHCDVAVCQPTLGNNCEPRCFRKRRDIGASAKGGTRAETTLVSSQELVIVGQDTDIQ